MRFDKMVKYAEQNGCGINKYSDSGGYNVSHNVFGKYKHCRTLAIAEEYIDSLVEWVRDNVVSITLYCPEREGWLLSPDWKRNELGELVLVENRCFYYPAHIARFYNHTSIFTRNSNVFGGWEGYGLMHSSMNVLRGIKTRELNTISAIKEYLNKMALLMEVA